MAQRLDKRFNANSPNSFPPTVLLNADRVDSTAITGWGRRQIRGDPSNFQIVHLPVGPAQSALCNKWNRGSALNRWAPCCRLTYHECQPLNQCAHIVYVLKLLQRSLSSERMSQMSVNITSVPECVFM